MVGIFGGGGQQKEGVFVLALSGRERKRDAKVPRVAGDEILHIQGYRFKLSPVQVHGKDD